MAQEDWVSLSEAARRSGLSVSTIRRWIVEGRLPGRREPQGRRFRWLVQVPERPVPLRGAPRTPAEGTPPNDRLLTLGADLERLRSIEAALPEIFRTHEEAARLMLELQQRAEDASRAALREAGAARAADERAAVAEIRDHRRSSALSFVTMLAGLTAAVAPSPEWVGQAGAIVAVLGLAIGLNEGYLYLSRRSSA